MPLRVLENNDVNARLRVFVCRKKKMLFFHEISAVESFCLQPQQDFWGVMVCYIGVTRKSWWSASRWNRPLFVQPHPPHSTDSDVARLWGWFFFLIPHKTRHAFAWEHCVPNLQGVLVVWAVNRIWSCELDRCREIMIGESCGPSNIHPIQKISTIPKF